MNTKLETILAQLNSSETVSLPEFIIALELEPQLDPASIFTGSQALGNSINWKNTLNEAGSMKDNNYLLLDNTKSWGLSLTKFSLNNIILYLKVETINDNGSIISAVIIGDMSSSGIIFPVLIIKSGDYLSAYLHIDNGKSLFYKYNILESLFDAPSLREYYPNSAKFLEGLDCLSMRFNYCISDKSMDIYSIKSVALEWSPGETQILNFKNCTMTCTINLPFDSTSISFTVSGDLTFSCVGSGIFGGSTLAPSFGDMTFLFQNNGLSVLTDLYEISGALINELKKLYVSTTEDVVTSIEVIFPSNNVSETRAVSLKQLNMVFYYSLKRCVLTGTLLSGNMILEIKSLLDLTNENPFTILVFEMQNNLNEGASFNLSDLSQFGLSIVDSIPFINNLEFTIHDFRIWTDIQPEVSIKNLSLAIGSMGSWQVLPSVLISNLFFDLTYVFEESINLYYGEISGEITIAGRDVYLSAIIPETGDWRISLSRSANEIINDDINTLPSISNKPGIPIPGIADILSLFGPNLSITDKLPTALKLEGIELTDLLIKFPNPTEMKIHTADFEIRLSSEWSLTSAFKLKNLILQCGIDFTGIEPTYAFNILGKVTIAEIDLSTVVTKTADDSWSFFIALDPSAEEKPNVKRMLSELFHFNLPDIFPDVAISEMELTGDITNNNYKFSILLTEVWNLKALTGLDIELTEILITGESDNGNTGGTITGLLELGGVKLSLSAILATSGGAGAGDLVFHGNLADGSEISIVDLLESININVSNIPVLDTFEIDQLDFSFNTGTGKSDLIIGCGFNIDLFGRNGLDLRGALSFSKATSSSEMTGTITGKIYLKSLCFEASFPIENVNESHITLKLYLPKPGQPDNPACVTCNIISENGNKRLSINLGQMNIFTMMEQLVNLMIPGMYLDFPSPWNRLESIQYSGEFILIIDLPEDDASPIKAVIVIPVGLINKLPMIELNTFVMNCNFDEFTIDVQMAGEIFGIDYNSGFDLISEDPPTPALPMGLLDLRYAGFGRHVSLNKQTNYTSMREVIQKLRTAFDQKPNSIGESGIFGALGYNPESEWLIGFDFTVAKFLRLSVIFNDPILYGMLIRLDGPAAGMFSGFEFEILYQRIAAGIGAYRMKLELPAYLRTIELGAMSLTLPFIGIDIYTNGNFKLDLGFPYESKFERSFALALFPFYGKGGFYFASLNGATSTSVPKIRNGSFQPVIEFGIGLQVGIGKSLNAGILRAQLTVGVYAIFEGVFAIFKPYDGNTSEAYFWRVQGVVGIAANLSGVVNFRLIKVGFSVSIYLESYIAAQCFEPILIGGRVGVNVRARVKISRWFKITFTFSKQVDISFTIGKRSSTPWIIDDKAPGAAKTVSYGISRRKENSLLRSMEFTPSRMLMAKTGGAGTGFDWDFYSSGDKAALTWHAYFGFSILNPNDDKRMAVAIPMICISEDQFEKWIINIYYWLMRAWLGDVSSITFKEAEDMEAAIGEAVESIEWESINGFIGKNFTITLDKQPLPSVPDDAQPEFNAVVVPIPPIFKISSDMDGVQKEFDLSDTPSINTGILDQMKELSSWYVRNSEKNVTGGVSFEPMAELLWKDITGLQLKELAARLLSLMKAYKYKNGIDGAEFKTIGNLYDGLCFDPDPSDADKRPFFEDFVTANVGTAGLLIQGGVMYLPGGGNVEILAGDTFESIAGRCNILPVELIEANLDTGIISSDGGWILPAVKNLEITKAWEKLSSELNIVADISAMTSRFLLHGLRLPSDADGDGWMGLYEIAKLQFDLNSTGFEKYKISYFKSVESADWICFAGEEAAFSEAASKSESAVDAVSGFVSKAASAVDSVVALVNQDEQEVKVENLKAALAGLTSSASSLRDAIQAMETGSIQGRFNLVLEKSAEYKTALEDLLGIIYTAPEVLENKINEFESPLDQSVIVIGDFNNSVDKLIKSKTLVVPFADYEKEFLSGLSSDPSFEPEAKITGMNVVKEKPVQFNLARTIPLKRYNTDKTVTPDGQIRLLTSEFFQYLSRNDNQHVDWIAKIIRRSHTAGNNDDNVIDKFDWMLRLDIDVRKTETAIVNGRQILQICELSPDVRLRVQSIADDLVNGLIISIVPAAGVAGAASATGGITAGADDDNGDIIIFRNDADINKLTPARAGNIDTVGFMQILAECSVEGNDSFFFADVLKGSADAGVVESAIFPDGGDKGVITLLVKLSGEVNPLKHADSVWLDALHDPGSSVLVLEAKGKTEKFSTVPPDHLVFRIERPEINDESGIDDKDKDLESLYSLLSFSFSGEDGNPSPFSVTVGPNIDEDNSKWFYEQVIPFETAYAEPKEYKPYDSVGKTRNLEIEWRDVYGNAVRKTFDGRSIPGIPFTNNLNSLTLTGYYWDDIVPVSQWPGVKMSHRFGKEAGNPNVFVQLRFDPSLLQSKLSQADDIESIRVQLNKIKDQLNDGNNNSGMTVDVETSLEDVPQIVSFDEKEQRKTKIINLIENIGILLDESASNLSQMNLAPSGFVTIEEFMANNRLDSRELALIIRDINLSMFLALDTEGNLPAVNIPVRWQTGSSDSIDLIANELNMVTSDLIEYLISNPEFLDDRAILKDGISINDLCKIQNITKEALLDKLKSSAVFSGNMVINIGKTTTRIELDENGEFETIGEVAVRIDNSYNASASDGFVLKTEPADILAANPVLLINTGQVLCSAGRLYLPAEQITGINKKFWKKADTVSSLIDVAADFEMSDFVHLNRYRSDIIIKDVVLVLKTATSTNDELSITTIETDTFETLRKAASAKIGDNLSLAKFISIISDVKIIKPDVYFLIPPEQVILQQPVTLKSASEAFVVNTSLILKRNPGQDLELIHPDLRDKPSVWYLKSEAPPECADITNDDAGKDSVPGLQPYARSFNETFSDTTNKTFGMYIAIGSKKQPGADGDSSDLFAVRIGNGGYNYEIPKDTDPAYLSLRPISTVPENRKKVKISSFITGTANITRGFSSPPEESDYVEKDYSGIDLDMWAQKTLDTLDRILKPSSALALSDIDKTENGNTYDDLLQSRAELSDVLTRGLTEVIDYPDADAAGSIEVVVVMKELIGNRLASAYDIDSIVLFPLTTSGKFKASGCFIDKTDDDVNNKETGWRLKPSSFISKDSSSEENWLVMPVDVLCPEENGYIQPVAYFQLETLEIEVGNDPVILSFVVAPDKMSLGVLSIPVPLRDIPEAPELTKQFGAPDFEISNDGEPDLDSFEDLLDWRYEIDYIAEFAEQDTHTMDIFFNMAAGESLPEMSSLRAAAYNPLFGDLFHALAQCDATLEQYAVALESVVKESVSGTNTGWIIDDILTLQRELTHWWGSHYNAGKNASLRMMAEKLQSSRHTYEIYEDSMNNDKDFVFTFICTKVDPLPMVRVDKVVSIEPPEISGDKVIYTDIDELYVIEDKDNIRTVTITLKDFFTPVRTSGMLDKMPRTIGFKNLNILKQQNVRSRMRIVRNAVLVPDKITADAFIYKTPVVSLRDRFFPCVEMGRRVRVEKLTGKSSYPNSTAILADIINGLLAVKDENGNANITPVKRRMAISIRYGFSMNGEWSSPDSFTSETPLFYVPLSIIGVPYSVGSDNFISKLGRDMDEWLATSGANRDNAGFVIGVDVFTDETLNPNLVDIGNTLGAEDDAMLLRLMKLEVDFPEQHD